MHDVVKFIILLLVDIEVDETEAELLFVEAVTTVKGELLLAFCCCPVVGSITEVCAPNRSVVEAHLLSGAPAGVVVDTEVVIPL